MRPQRVAVWVFLGLLGLGMRAEATSFRSVVECDVSQPTVYCIFGEPAVSPDGRCLAYTDATSWPPWYEVWPVITLVPLEAGGCSPGIPVVASSNNWHFAPTWSPDGTTLAFVSDGWDGESRGLWTLDLRDPESPSALRHLTDAVVRDLAWSPDGGTLAYAGTGGIYTIPPSGGSPALWIPNASCPSWGPEGQIVFVRNLDLWIREANGTERPLTATTAYESDPAWSPQGDWIAYASNESGNWDIWIIASRGGTPVPLTTDAGNQRSPSWSASADRIAFVSVMNENDSIWLATDLPEWTTPVSTKTWSALKQLYR